MSKAGLNFTWGPPSPSVLNFSNSSCSQIASITAYRRSIDADIFDSWLESAKYNDKRRTVELVELIRQGLQSYFDEKGLNGSFSADIEDWVFADKNVWNKAIQFALYNCKNELCQQVGWAGNADIVGRGVGISISFPAAWKIHLADHYLDASHIRASNNPDHNLRPRFADTILQTDVGHAAAKSRCV